MTNQINDKLTSSFAEWTIKYKSMATISITKEQEDTYINIFNETNTQTLLQLQLEIVNFFNKQGNYKYITTNGINPITLKIIPINTIDYLTIKQPEQQELSFYELALYFTKTVTQDEVRHKNEKTIWTEFYLNPYAGIKIKLGESTLFDLSNQSIKKIQICEDFTDNTYPKMICFYDKHDQWLEDIDINTNLPWENIKFCFDKEDLKHCETNNSEKQAYVELYDQLNPYNPPLENRKIIHDWLNKNKKIIGEN